MQFIQDVGDDVGAKGLHIRRRLAAKELLEVTFLEIAFERVDAGDAQHRPVKQTVDHVEGGNFGSASLVGEAGQQIRQSKDMADVLFELAEFAAGTFDLRRQRSGAQPPTKGPVPFPTAPLVLGAATTVARLVTTQPQRIRDATRPVGSFQNRVV
jgi:hypothetical protein